MRLFLLLLALLVAAPALAAPPTSPSNQWTGCSSSATAWEVGTTATPSVGEDGRACLEIDEGFSTGTTSFRVAASTASVCAILDVTASAATGDVRPILYSCPTGFTPDTDVCSEVVKTWTDDSCVAVSRGRYLIDIPTTAVTAGEDAIIAVQGY